MRQGLPTLDVLRLMPLLPRAWVALRAARARLATSVQSGLQLRPVAVCRQALNVDRQARAVFALGRRMRGCACLAQAIALAELLRGYGHHARVVVGATRETGTFQAHAWVELEARKLDPQGGSLELTAVQSFG